MTEHHPAGPTPADEAGAPIRAARDAMAVRRVFGEAHVVDGATVIPVAAVRGGGGMGFGSGAAGGPHDAAPGEAQEGSGGGGGFGVTARPLGVYVVRDGQVRWEPALDLNRVIFTGQLLGLVTVLAAAWVWGRRRG